MANTSLVGFAISAACALISYILIPFLRDPYGLRKYPGPFVAKFTYAWSFWAGIRLNRPERIHAAHMRYGAIVRVSPSELSFCDPAAYDKVHAFYTKISKSGFYDTFATIGLRNLFTARLKSDHGQKRKLMHPLFTSEVARDFAAPTISVTSRLLEQWDQRYISSLPAEPIWFECVPWITYLSFDLVAAFVFGETLQMVDRAADLVQAPQDWRTAFEFDIAKPGAAVPKQYLTQGISLSRTVSEREASNYLLGLLPAGWRPAIRRFLYRQVASATTYAGFVAHAVDQRLSASKAGPDARDLLGRLLHKAKLQNEAINPASLTAEIITLLVAGSDTTRNTLLAAIFYIAQNPSVQKGLQSELDMYIPGSSSTLSSFGEVELLPYLGACINETLRLFAPVGMGLPRTIPASGISICGEHIAPGVTVGVPIYSLHRNTEVWGPDAEVFNPARWLGSDGDLKDSDEPVAKAFKPFSDGPAACIGKTLALLQLRLILAMIFKRYEVCLEDPAKALQSEQWFVRRVIELKVGLTRRV
ncbi:Cytochrome P450 [Mycena kentingensis (nom. inval.)]|nr:Cytochrome P450 [Mycena kentingensis (nom. inval.)]